MVMRVACGIHGKGANGPGDLTLVLETYELMSQKWCVKSNARLSCAISERCRLISVARSGRERGLERF